MTATKRCQSGVGLIEVLISVLVLSVGLLGIASLQVRAIKNNHSSLGRSMAVIQTYSISDAMRIDRTNAITGAFNLGLETDPPIGSSFAASVLTNWRQSLRTLLGASAKGSVDCNKTACTIVVQWDDSRATQGSETQQVRVEVQL